MKAVICGEVINSSEIELEVWIKELTILFRTIGKESKDWKIINQNHFQLIIDAHKAFEFALLIKATLKSISTIDAIISIGIGEINDDFETISEGKGSAFVYSKEQFSELKKSTLAIKTPDERLNQELKTIVDLVNFIVQNWTEKMADYFKITFVNQNLNQKQLAEMLELKSQSTISSILKKIGYDEIIQAIVYYQIKIQNL